LTLDDWKSDDDDVGRDNGSERSSVDGEEVLNATGYWLLVTRSLLVMRLDPRLDEKLT
jgi:hypothetical protein